ncbi:hypothetical protein TNCV_4596121 [Trichonephila clavipes]|uniref:Uncharacterized protein n=1 Tax=Trichonephila clavipes TaxID=2585209 RepID=A0A8X7BKS5_TRICX|nr:hypothetical protein TNCV_4596121 [Trichonephila clavipes]
MSVIFTSHYKAARGLLEPSSKDENDALASIPSPNFHITPMGGRLCLDRFNEQLHGRSRFSRHRQDMNLFERVRQSFIRRCRQECLKPWVNWTRGQGFSRIKGPLLVLTQPS